MDSTWVFNVFLTNPYPGFNDIGKKIFGQLNLTKVFTHVSEFVNLGMRAWTRGRNGK